MKTIEQIMGELKPGYTAWLDGKDVTVFGDPVDAKALDQLGNCLVHPAARKGSLMADHHLGYSMPIGGVVAYEDAISPTGVGFDIACGNKCVRTNLTLLDLGIERTMDGCEESIKTFKPIMRAIQKKVSFGIGRTSGENVDHALFDDPLWSVIDLHFGTGLKQKAAQQLGTVGSGNHYVDLLVDDMGRIWVANHFGSRGFGHTIASGFMAKASGKEFTDRIPESEEAVVLSTKEHLGMFYVEAMKLAGDYAYAGRDYVIDQVLEILGARAEETVHNHHNFAWLEDGHWVVRKGATPLTSAPAFIGGSMGDVSVIVRGKSLATEFPGSYGHLDDHIEDIGALGSAPHGAGRVMSRSKAAGKIRKLWSCNNRDCRFEQSGGQRPDVCPDCGNDKFRKFRGRDASTAAIDWTAVRRDLTDRGIVVLGAGADEAPGVYKDLETVLSEHSNIKVLERLHPIGVVMAGPDEHDPYKD